MNTQIKLRDSINVSASILFANLPQTVLTLIMDLLDIQDISIIARTSHLFNNIAMEMTEYVNIVCGEMVRRPHHISYFPIKVKKRTNLCDFSNAMIAYKFGCFRRYICIERQILCNIDNFAPDAHNCHDILRKFRVTIPECYCKHIILEIIKHIHYLKNKIDEKNGDQDDIFIYNSLSNKVDILSDKVDTFNLTHDDGDEMCIFKELVDEYMSVYDICENSIDMREYSRGCSLGLNGSMRAIHIANSFKWATRFIGGCHTEYMEKSG
jgi:hypothetical protein